MTTRESFIVDNTSPEWKALDYVREWCDISDSIDIATGHFEIGAFLALDGAWQKVNKIRLLIGGETSRTTVDAITEALDRSITAERQLGDPFLSGAEAVVEGIRSGVIEIRVYRTKKFHAKAYITHSRLKVVGSAALVGSSNFTRPGLTQNVELNVKFQGPEVDELQNWYETHWNEAEPVNPAVLTVLEQNVRSFSPYEVYAKAIRSLTANVDPGDRSWEETESAIYPVLAPYQREAFRSMVEMSKQWGGGFLTDGVGLGKTFVGLMLTEYYAVRKRKNVLIMATKTGQDAVWNPEIADRLPDLSGGQFSNVIVKAHTDLTTKAGIDEIEHLAKRADVVIIDEAHNFRNRGSKPSEENPLGSRWWRMQRICAGKTVFLLTATPINNNLFDLVHQVELFTGLDADAHFASIGIGSLRRYFVELERQFKNNVPDQSGIDELLAEDGFFQSVIHQNSRRYAIESARLSGLGDVHFPETQIPRVISYDFGMLYAPLFAEIKAAFNKKDPLFVLPMYYPLAFSTDESVDTVLQNRQKQIVALIRTVFLKRFESSLAAFAGSCIDLSAKMLHWLDVNVTGDVLHETKLREWRARHQPTLKALHDEYRPTVEEGWHEEDITEEELEELEYNLNTGSYKLDEMIGATFGDLDQLARLMELILNGSGLDEKYARLRTLLLGPSKDEKRTLDESIFTEEFRTQPVIVFTEFADTARYLEERLIRDGLSQVDRIDGSRGGDRYGMIRRFAPFYNKVAESERHDLEPIRVLISTDVLSEGVNLQDGTLLVNYDLHWNPVRLMQRIGRVDRRMNPEVESALIKERPKAKSSRGHIQVRNFLAPSELDTLISLQQRVDGKTLMISKTLGIPGGKLLDEDDMFDDVKVFQAFKDEYTGDITPIEQLRLKWQQMVQDDPVLEERVARLPDGISVAKSSESPGLFVCRRVPVLMKETDESEPVWTIKPGRIQWSLKKESGVQRALLPIDAIIQADESIPAGTGANRSSLRVAIRAFEIEENKRMRKEQQVPLDAPSAETICWIELA